MSRLRTRWMPFEMRSPVKCRPSRTSGCCLGTSVSGGHGFPCGGDNAGYSETSKGMATSERRFYDEGHQPGDTLASPDYRRTGALAVRFSVRRSTGRCSCPLAQQTPRHHLGRCRRWRLPRHFRIRLRHERSPPLESSSRRPKNRSTVATTTQRHALGHGTLPDLLDRNRTPTPSM